MKSIALTVILALACSLAMGDRFCHDTQYWNGTGCTACPAGCGLCVYDSSNKTVSCTTCLHDHMYLNISNRAGRCANCSAHCAACRGPSPMECLKFEANYTLNPITRDIVKCDVEHCQYCTGNNSCARCNYKYRLENGHCNPCSAQGCAECNISVSNCTKCFAGFALANHTCKKCPDHCEFCNSNGTCGLCSSGFNIHNGACVPHTCTEHCTHCDNNKTCHQCAEGHFLKNGSCSPCSTHCDKCTSATECHACSVFSDENGFHYSLNNGSCKKCNDANCKTCDGNGTCSVCGEGYFKNGTDCKICISGCSECNNATHCTRCRVHSKLTANATKCTAYTTCKEGQQLDAHGNCTNGTIDNCLHGDTENKTCFECSAGYFAHERGCEPCPAGCIECARNTSGYLICKRAHGGDGFSIITNHHGREDHVGYNCPHNCAHCDKNGNCTACMPNLLFAQELHFAHHDNHSHPMNHTNHTNHTNGTNHTTNHTGPSNQTGHHDFAHHAPKLFCVTHEACTHPVDGMFNIQCYHGEENPQPNKPHEHPDYRSNKGVWEVVWDILRGWF